MISLSERLKSVAGISLSVATTYSGRELIRHFDEGITYFLLPREKPNSEYDKSLEKYWIEIVNEFNPDIIHIHGTEYAHGLSCLNSCPQSRFVVSIQGLIGASGDFYFSGIKHKDILWHITIHDLLKRETLYQERRRFIRRSKFEKEYLTRIPHVIGRTDWDRAHTREINPEQKYHLCNEILRGNFYKAKRWEISEKNDFSIFLSQAGYPLKGVHQVLKAISIVKRYFPLVKVRIAGYNITKVESIREKIRIGGYGSYLRSLISRLNLSENVVFTGALDQDEMAEELRKAHLFICPSSIENSSNSVAEAQIIGVPSITSFVGGLPSMIKHGETGLLYRFEDHIMLAYYIRQIFENDQLATILSENGRKVATERHNGEEICLMMLSIYSRVIEI